MNDVSLKMRNDKVKTKQQLFNSAEIRSLRMISAGISSDIGADDSTEKKKINLNFI